MPVAYRNAGEPGGAHAHHDAHYPIARSQQAPTARLVTPYLPGGGLHRPGLARHLVDDFDNRNRFSGKVMTPLSCAVGNGHRELAQHALPDSGAALETVQKETGVLARLDALITEPPGAVPDTELLRREAEQQRAAQAALQAQEEVARAVAATLQQPVLDRKMHVPDEGVSVSSEGLYIWHAHVEHMNGRTELVGQFGTKAAAIKAHDERAAQLDAEHQRHLKVWRDATETARNSQWTQRTTEEQRQYEAPVRPPIAGDQSYKITRYRRDDLRFPDTSSVSPFPPSLHYLAAAAFCGSIAQRRTTSTGTGTSTRTRTAPAPAPALVHKPFCSQFPATAAPWRARTYTQSKC